MSHESHNDMTPFSVWPTLPVATSRLKQGATGSVAIREAQVYQGQLGRERECRLDWMSNWKARDFWLEIENTVGHEDSVIPRPPYGLLWHDYPRGLSVSGYALCEGLIVQRMVNVIPRNGLCVVWSQSNVYGPGVTRTPSTSPETIVSSKDMSDQFLRVIAKVHDEMCAMKRTQRFDIALTRAREMDAATINRHWQTSRRLATAARAENFAPDAALAF
ncbi:hypothetical protein J7355_15665 [Endozoicomonas sp. G2_2]|uniref:hypothetical protein n=1 Tax=Endozoicomonas sp. G2_2 TaxID=2821092 RepID=UPI001ADBE56B|nr:hypothetical protein [Endozoicomonas sp. G2_2]MBO9471527.1 hypothetical protein [Endozoicomonas sp. G2_2]